MLVSIQLFDENEWKVKSILWPEAVLAPHITEKIIKQKKFNDFR